MIKVEYLDVPVEIGCSFIPAKIQTQCPKCQKIIQADLSKSKIDDAVINQVFDLCFSHSSESNCDHRWSTKVIMRVGLFEAAPATFKGFTTPKSKVEVIKAFRNEIGCGLLDAKKWVETAPHGINKDLGEKLEAAGAIIEWRY